MTDLSIEELDQAEDRLQYALLTADVDTLEDLLDPEAVYVGPDGVEVGRAADLAAHRDGTLDLTTVTELRRSTRRFDATGTTRVALQLVGRAGSVALDATLVYTRTWRLQGGRWRVVQAHASVSTPASTPDD